MRRKNRSGRWTVPPTGHKKGGDIQGMRTASAAGAETLSDALGTRLWNTVISFVCVPDQVGNLAEDGISPNMGWPNKELTTLSLLRPKIP